jgi:hypothetical protein
MTNEVHIAIPMREQTRKDLMRFDFTAPAELFPSRSKKGRGRVTYKRFDTGAEAVRFAVEGMPEPALLGACLESDEMRFGKQEIRALYDSPAYPLPRRAAAD